MLVDSSFPNDWGEINHWVPIYFTYTSYLSHNVLPLYIGESNIGFTAIISINIRLSIITTVSSRDLSSVLDETYPHRLTVMIAKVIKIEYTEDMKLPLFYNRYVYTVSDWEGSNTKEPISFSPIPHLYHDILNLLPDSPSSQPQTLIQSSNMTQHFLPYHL